MGQYHKLVTLTGFEFVRPGDLDCAPGAWQILATPYRVNAALAALISVSPGDRPADLSHNPFVERWAGHRILCVGDYAKDGDAANIPGYTGPALPTLYELLDERNLLPARKAPGVYYNVSANVRGMLEHGCSVRFIGRAGDICVPVKTRARIGPTGWMHFDIVGDEEVVRYQQDIQHYASKPWDRAPSDGSTDSIADDDIDKGQVRVLANTDRREFIDPAAFGEVPTTAGIMRGNFGSAAAMMGMLFEPEARGGGDLAIDSPLIGLWRNGRLFASSESEHPQLPTTGYIKDNWTDLSKEARQFISAIVDELGRE
ncbi:MAG TPA: hypothetical protein VFZ03_04335 [Dongiaceae bacterium]